MLFALLLTAALVAPATADPGTGPPTTADLGELVPAHHALHGFTGRASWFRHQPAPIFRFEEPDFDGWAAGLETAEADPGADRFVVVWRDDAGALRHVLVKEDDRSRLFTIDGDSIEFEDPGFYTQVGVARWGFEYRDGLLQTHRTWRLTLGPTGTERPVGPPAPSALFSVTTYEYRSGAKVPSRGRVFWNEADRRAGRWGQKLWFGPDGRPVKTKQNPERPYPY